MLSSIAEKLSFHKALIASFMLTGIWTGNWLRRIWWSTLEATQSLHISPSAQGKRSVFNEDWQEQHSGLSSWKWNLERCVHRIVGLFSLNYDASIEISKSMLFRTMWTPCHKCLELRCCVVLWQTAFDRTPHIVAPKRRTRWEGGWINYSRKLFTLNFNQVHFYSILRHVSFAIYRWKRSAKKFPRGTALGNSYEIPLSLTKPFIVFLGRWKLVGLVSAEQKFSFISGYPANNSTSYYFFRTFSFLFYFVLQRKNRCFTVKSCRLATECRTRETWAHSAGMLGSSTEKSALMSTPWNMPITTKEREGALKGYVGHIHDFNCCCSSSPRGRRFGKGDLDWQQLHMKYLHLDKS